MNRALACHKRTRNDKSIIDWCLRPIPLKWKSPSSGDDLMRVDLYGLNFETPRVTCYLWSPWRASALEHRLFDVVRSLQGVTVEEDAGEVRAHVTDAKAWRAALLALCRVLKGWQEEVDPRREM